MSRIYRNLFVSILLSFFLLHLPQPSFSQVTILDAVDLVINQSDLAMDFEDNLRLKDMDVEVVAHRFTTKLVPLTNIGFVQGTGSQQLGLEFRRDIPTGLGLSYGVVANRVDDNGDYEVTNPVNARAYVKVSQGFFRRWGTKYNLTDLTIAELRAKEEGIKAKHSQQGLILKTVGSYYDLVLAKQLVGKAENALKRSGENLESAMGKQSVGLGSKVDVYRAELALLEGQRLLMAHKRELRRKRNYLRELLRYEREDELQVSPQIELLTPLLPDTWEENILNSRLDWQAQRINFAINNHEIDRARQNLLPDLGLSFTLEQKGEGDAWSDAIELDQTNWSIQLEVLSDLDSFSEQNILDRVRLKRAKLRRSHAAMRRRIFMEVEEAYENLLTEEKNHQISKKRLAQAYSALDLAKTRYEKGLSGNLDLVDAEAAYSDAELDTVRAKKEFNLASVSLAFKLGVLDREWLEQSLPTAEPLVSNFYTGIDKSNGWK